MKKGFLALVLVLLIASIVAVGCGGATPAATSAATEAATQAGGGAATQAGGGAAGAPADCSADGGCAVFKTGETIKIGVGGPMTGDNSAFGIDAFQGSQLAVKDAGTFKGVNFDVVQGDDLGTGDGGAAVANKFVADPTIVAVMGHSFSGATTNAMPIYATHFIPMMSESATRVDLSQQNNPSFNRLVGTDKLQGSVGANFIVKNLGLKKVAVMHDGTPYGQGLAQGVSDNLKAAGVNVVAFEAITPGGTDYTAVLTKIAALKPDGVFYGGYQPEAAVLATEKAGVGLNVPFVSGDGVFGTQFIDLAKDKAEGYYVTQAAAPNSDAKTKFNAAYKAQFGKDAGSLSGYTWFAYDATMVLIQAVEKVAIVSGDSVYVPRKALVAAVRATKGYQGLTGTVTCDPNGECASASAFGVFQVQKGAFVQLAPDYKPS